MARVNTLTAYKCKFRYMQRNNPLIEKQKEEIKSGKNPQITFEEFISLYISGSADILIGKNSDRAIGLTEEQIARKSIEKTKSWHISPKAGKQGQPMTVIKQSTHRRYDFGADAAALYNYHIFVYEDDNGIIAIFHRQNGSGCKSVFLETANDILKEYGIKLEMELIIPIYDEVEIVAPTKITLQYVENNASSDIADNIKPKRKKTVIREIRLNLEARDNSAVAGIIHNMQLGKISKEIAFAQIKNEVEYSEDFNDAEISFKIGKRKRKTSWSDFENIVGVYDISSRLNTAYKQSKDFNGELTKIADQYFKEIIDSGVIDGE